MVISALVRGAWRRYPLVLAYSLALLLSTVVEIAAKPFPRAVQDNYYWTDEVILEVLVFCLVLTFIDDAARESRQKMIARRWLIMGAVLILAVSISVHSGLRLNRQMTLVSRDLNICAVILDLVLWSLLLTARRPDRCLLLLSGGLGLSLTGAIMGEQLRQQSHRLFLAGTLVEVTTGFLGLYIWWRALKLAAARPGSPTQKKSGLPQEPARY